MLISFEVENFRSFKKKTVFHTLQRNFKRFTNHIYNHSEELSILKTSAIYGANGSGKTNLFKALNMIKYIVEDSDYLKSSDAIKNFTPFRLHKDNLRENSKFLVDFISEDQIFSYEIEIDTIQKIIVFEKLSLLPNLDYKIEIFSRKTENGRTFLSFPKESPLYELEAIIGNIISPHSSVICQEFMKLDTVVSARNWFVHKLKFMFPIYEFFDISYILSLKEEYLRLANRIIKFSNVGINELRIDRVPIEVFLGLDNRATISQISASLENKQFHSFRDTMGNFCTAIKDAESKIVILKLICLHNDSEGGSVAFEVDQESRGTIVLLHLIPALILSYGEGVNYFLDDINTSLHPILIKEILGQYLTHNLLEAKGQLIFNSHEDFIMDERIVRQDELWLMEKKEGGESDLFPLSDFENIRFDLNLRKNYLNGKFGAVPFSSKPEILKYNE